MTTTLRLFRTIKHSKFPQPNFKLQSPLFTEMTLKSPLRSYNKSRLDFQGNLLQIVLFTISKYLPLLIYKKFYRLGHWCFL